MTDRIRILLNFHDEGYRCSGRKTREKFADELEVAFWDFLGLFIKQSNKSG